MNEIADDFDEDQGLPEDHWLCKMDGYLDWRVIGPQINNPYEVSIPDRVLDAMSKNRDVVRKLMRVRCLCDGHEVLAIDNLAAPIPSTDHPCLVGISRKEIVECFAQFHVNEEIERSIDKIQEEVANEMHRREMNRLANRAGSKTVAEIKAEKEAEKKAKKASKKPGDGKGSQIRVIRR